MWKHTAQCKMNIKIDLRNCVFDMNFVITKKWLNPMVNSTDATLGTLEPTQQKKKEKLTAKSI